MTTTQLAPEQPATYTTEGGGWVVLSQPEPGLEKKTPAELLALGATLPGNLRYVAAPSGVLLFGEAHSPAGVDTLDEARQRLAPLLDDPPAVELPPPEEETVEAALEGSGLGWTRRDQGWAVPASALVPRELQVRREPGGVRVAAVLVEWDELGATERAALAQFLFSAQAGLRLVRCELDERGARLVSWVAAPYLDTDLAHSLQAVAVGCRLLAREATALLVPEVAQMFLEFHQSGGK